MAQAGVSRTAEVFSTGVATIDADSATALVAGTFTDSYPDQPGELQPQEPVPFRIQVTLVKTDGEWLVDDFTPVTGAEPVSAAELVRRPRRRPAPRPPTRSGSPGATRSPT